MLKLFFVLLALGSFAFGHTSVGETSGFVHGFSHPIGGADHLLAMFAVGLFAASVGGKSLYVIPLIFVGMMAIGGILGINAVEVSFVEEAILASVVAIGALAAFGMRLPLVVASLIVGVFAIFHGVAHGAEMPISSNGFAYGLGFMIATSLIHIAGIVFSVLISKTLNSKITKATGLAISAAGLALASF